MLSNSINCQTDPARRVQRMLGGACLLLAMAACRPVEMPPPPQAVAVGPEASATAAADRAAATPVGPEAGGASADPTDAPVRAPQVVSWSAGGLAFEGVAFDSRGHRLRLVDQAGGPGSLFANAAEAARAADGLAAVNAGFFTPEGEPLGLAVAAGQAAGNWNRESSLAAGIWYEDGSGIQRISRRGALGAERARRMPELLQSGPMLVEDGRAVRGLGGGEPRPRTLIAWDGGSRWWIGRAAPCTMPAMAEALAGSGGPGFRVLHALNLDGGRSSELWVDGGVSGGPLTRRPLLNRRVRNHLVLVAR